MEEDKNATRDLVFESPEKCRFHEYLLLSDVFVPDYDLFMFRVLHVYAFWQVNMGSTVVVS